jgi:site-specific DNA recombinase
MNRASIRAAIYARVSSEQQAKNDTIASQVDALRDRVGRDGLDLDPEMAFVDEGYSGGSLVRPALERLRDQAAAGALDRLYVLAPDRLARRYAYQVLLVDELHRCGVEVVFLDHPPGRTPRRSCCCRSRAWSPSTSGRRSSNAAAAGSATPPAAARSAS